MQKTHVQAPAFPDPWLSCSLTLTSRVQHQSEIQSKVKISYQSILRIWSQPCESHSRSWVRKCKRW